jgi:casein kinase II subunit beta
MSRSSAPTEEELQSESFLALNSETSDMYGLIHARYIRSPEGLALVYGKYL